MKLEKKWGVFGSGGEGGDSVKPSNSETPSDGKVTTDGNHIWFYKDVSQSSIQALVSALRETSMRLQKETADFNLSNGLDIEPPPIHVHIHSYGGSVFAGFAAADAILRCDLPVFTHVEGGAASAATMFSIMGAHRTIGANAFMLIHQLSSVAWGNYEQLKDDMQNNDLLMKRITAIYTERTKLSKAQIGKILKKDLWFDAQKCLKAGLVDEIW